MPYLDKITFEFGQEPTVAVLRLKKGEVDIVGDGIPPAQFAEVMADPANKDLIVEGDQLHTGYVTMNVNAAALRQCEGAPGGQHGDQQGPHRPHHQQPRACRPPRRCRRRCRATTRTTRAIAYDPEGAKKLLAEAGVGDGFATELYAMNVDPNPRIAQAIQQDLAAVGIKAEIRSLAQAEVIAAGGAGKAPMIWSGGMAWIADFPDPANFYYGILGCAGAVRGRLELVEVLQQGRSTRGPTKADAMVEGRPGRGADRRVEGHLRRRAEGGALGAGLQREALHLSTRRGSAATRRSSPIRSTSR